MWKPEAVNVTQGADMIDAFSQNPATKDETVISVRKWCKACGGHILTEHPTMGLVDVYAATIPGFPFKAGVHIHYQETVLPMKDGLPKMQDLPAEAGGSGVELPE